MGELGDKLTDEILEKFGHDQERFADLGGYIYHARVDAVLQGLGFDAEESKTRLVSTLSGGERGRVGLAAQLIAPADLLLLDEPTNHLDLDTTTWLQEWLGDADETVIVVSHDRAFLDAICTNILHVEAKTSEAYKGNYSQFVPQRAERRLTREREMEKQRAYVKKEEEYIRRNIAGVNSFQAKGKRKRLERLPRLAPPPGDPAAMNLQFDVGERGGDQVVAIKDLRVEVPGRVLVDDFTAVLRRNEFVALVGPNGAGKSSFISTILGDRAPAPRRGARGRFDHAGLVPPGPVRPPDRQVAVRCDQRPAPALESRSRCKTTSAPSASAARRSSARSVRSAAASAPAWHSRASRSPRANLLVLDEPTNHLDVENIEVLEDALDEYEGTVLLVSHDRAFLREVATRVWWFDGTQLKDFDGPFVDWEAERARKGESGARVASGGGR